MKCDRTASIYLNGKLHLAECGMILNHKRHVFTFKNGTKIETDDSVRRSAFYDKKLTKAQLKKLTK